MVSVINQPGRDFHNLNVRKLVTAGISLGVNGWCLDEYDPQRAQRTDDSHFGPTNKATTGSPEVATGKSAHRTDKSRTLGDECLNWIQTDRGAKLYLQLPNRLRLGDIRVGTESKVQQMRKRVAVDGRTLSNVPAGRERGDNRSDLRRCQITCGSIRAAPWPRFDVQNIRRLRFD